MIIAPMRKDREYDEFLDQVITGIESGLSNDDDALLACGGDPGTGKTRLMFHAYTRYAGELASIEQIAMTPRDMAVSLDKGRRLLTKRFLGYDEANVSKREAMTKWNKKLIDVYMNIRGLNFLHWWNNGSIEILDKQFIEERVKGVIFILTKSKSKPRLYYYFTKEGILKLLEEQGNLKKRTIVKHGGKYAFYLGWFKDYHGPLLSDYQKMKKNRMIEKVESFREEFAPIEKFNFREVAEQINASTKSVNRAFKYGVSSGLMELGVHYVTNVVGTPKLTVKGIEQAEFILKNGLHNKDKPTKSPKSRFRPIPIQSIYTPGRLD